MADTPHTTDRPDFPEAVAAPRSRRSIQLVWLIPLVAALVGGWLAVKSILDRGPTITITLKTAEGLEAGKTKLKTKDVDVGLVQSVVLAQDQSHVIATAELAKQSKNLLVDDTRFWVVRPRISGGSVSGLGTLLSGSYIGVDAGTGKTSRTEFVGLETAPIFTTDAPGREFLLRSEELGSLDTGSPVYFRRFQVGQIASYELDKDGKGVTLRVFVNAPYDQYVTTNTRFWDASGIDVSLDAAIRAASESEARYVNNSVMLLAEYNRKTAPLTRVRSADNVIAAETRDGKLVVPVPLDYIPWVAPVETFARRTDLKGTERWLLIAGKATPRATKELASLGWRVSGVATR